MAQELDELLSFLMERAEDERISIQKEIKYGHRNYWITLDIDEDPAAKSSGNNSWGRYSGRMSIHFDCRNGCIVMNADTTDISQITFEDKPMLEKWADSLEEYISSRIDSNFRDMVDQTFSSCHKKDFHRDWKMRKILDDEDESI
jgi:hypothetical protein